MTRAIFLDAVGTLFYLPLGVGHHYAVAGALIGAKLDPAALDRAFREVYPEMPLRPATRQPREDDDKGWWRELVRRVLLRVPHGMSELDQDSFFEAAYAHFAEAGVWELYPEVLETLERLQTVLPLFVLSNFDGRLRVILERLGISRFFKAVFVSSELGADKPDPLIFQLAAHYAGFPATEILHVGDDPERDWRAAAEAGLSVFELSRPLNSLRDIATILNRPR